MYRIPAVIAAWTAAGDGPRDVKTFFRFPEPFASCPVLKEVLVFALGCSEAAATKQCVLIAANRNYWYTFSLAVRGELTLWSYSSAVHFGRKYATTLRSSLENGDGVLSPDPALPGTVTASLAQSPAYLV